MIQQRVQVWLLLVFSVRAPSQWEIAFPMSWFKKTAVRSVVHFSKKRLMVAGLSKVQRRITRVPRRDGHLRRTSNPSECRTSSGETTKSRTPLKQSTNPDRLDQYPRRCHVRTWKPTSWRCSCHWVAGWVCGSFRTTRELPKNLRLTRHMPIGGPRDGARIPKSARRARRARRAY